MNIYHESADNKKCRILPSEKHLCIEDCVCKSKVWHSCEKYDWKALSENACWTETSPESTTKMHPEIHKGFNSFQFGTYYKEGGQIDFEFV